MSSQTLEAPTTTATEHRASFFRQSGWLMIANVAGGALMWAVHFLSKRLDESEYGVFGTMLSLVMVVPAMPLQMVLAQQTAKALAIHREGQLAGILRMFWFGTTALWVVAMIGVFLFQSALMENWKLTNSTVLWLTMPVLLLALWMPVFWGVLQGRQNFLWLGWCMMSNAAGRIGVAAVAVLVIAASALGMMAGVLAGMALGTGIAIWHSRDLWSRAGEAFDRQGLLRQIIPLMFGFGAFQFLFTADTMFVKAYFSSEETAFYASAGTLSRALMWLVAPLASVMFPRIVHSSVKSEKTNLMTVVLLGSAVLSACGAIGLTVLGPWVVKFVFKPSYVEVATRILPWYAWAMLPIALVNVLLNDLLARGAYRVVWPLVAVVAAYAFALTRYHASLVMVLQTLGVFGLIALGVCALFRFGAKKVTTSTH